MLSRFSLFVSTSTVQGLLNKDILSDIFATFIPKERRLGYTLKSTPAESLLFLTLESFTVLLVECILFSDPAQDPLQGPGFGAPYHFLNEESKK